MTDHPMTEERAAELWDAHAGSTVPWRDWYGGSRRALTSMLRAAFDAGRDHERAEDGRPWEPLNDRPLRAGDEVRQEMNGVTTIAVVGSVDKDGDPWTTEHRLIGVLEDGAWYVRRAAQEPPPERDGVVLVPADGHKAITTSDGREFSRLTFTTKQSIWYGPNLAARPGDWVIQTTSPGRLTPDTWKVAGQ